MGSAPLAPRLLVSGLVLGQPAGGVRRHNAELLPRLTERLVAAGGGLAVLEGKAPIPFPLPPTVERLRCAVPASPAPLRAGGEGPALRRVLARAEEAGQPFDAVHLAHLPVPRSLPVPRTHTIHDLRALDGEYTPVHRRRAAGPLLKRALGQASLVFTVSETVRARVMELFAVPAERIHVLPNGTDHLPIAPRDATGGCLLHVGHLEPRKNIVLLLEALAADPELPSLVLAGAPKRDEEARLRRLAAALGVGARVEFRGPFREEELPGLYAGAACLVMPSRLEGFGIPVAEAQAAGVPVAVAHTDALREVAGPDTPTFPVDDAAACAAAIQSAIAGDQAGLETARVRAAARTWDAAADAWFGALMELRAGW